MKIALAQMEVIAGDPERNIKKMLQMIEQAKKEGVNLIAFPEMAVSGYFMGDKWLDNYFCKNLIAFNHEIQKASKDIAIVYGNVFYDDLISERLNDCRLHSNQNGHIRRYNAIYLYQNGNAASRLHPIPELPEGVQPKTLLQNYRFFDDERYFYSLKDIAIDLNRNLEDLIQPFLIKFNDKEIPVGFEIWENHWCNDYLEKNRSINSTKILLNHGAELIVNISASPWFFEKNEARDHRIQFLKMESGEKFKPFLYINCIGVQNSGKNIFAFDGGSTVYSSKGFPVLFSQASYEEELLIVKENDFLSKSLERKEKGKIAQKYEAIISGIKHVKDMIGSDHQPKYIIGLSGGVDSSVVAALLTLAVGPDRVLCINMPTKYNTKKTRYAANHVASALGLKCIEIPINEMVDLNEQLLNRFDLDNTGKKLSVLNMENVQAKIRGTSILSNLAGKYQAVFTNNGNKLEIALGYVTLYGDMDGTIAPIGDLTKEEIFDLARFLNKEIFESEVIPYTMLPNELFQFDDGQIQPSAELKENQIDPMKFGYHCRLIEKMTDYMKLTTEDIMQWYLDGTMEKNLGISNTLIRRWGIDDPEEFIRDIEWFAHKMHTSVFKRLQSPPIIITSKSAYGLDIQESILPFYFSLLHCQLKKKILKLKKYQSRERKQND